MVQLLSTKIEVAENAEFDLNDGSSETRLATIIFSHGVGSKAEDYSGYCREIASFGYLVFAPDCIDGSSCYTELADGTVGGAHGLPSGGEACDHQETRRRRGGAA